LKLPYVYGQDHDETPFAAAVLRSAFTRPAEFSSVQAELHINGDGLAGTALNNVIHNIKHALRKKLPAGAEVLLCMWPKSLDRKLIAGRLTTSAGATLRAPKWGISFNHVARPKDDAGKSTAWAMIPTHDLQTFSRDVDADSPAVLHRETLVV
jgi:hypothetical protein